MTLVHSLTWKADTCMVKHVYGCTPQIHKRFCFAFKGPKRPKGPNWVQLMNLAQASLMSFFSLTPKIIQVRICQDKQISDKRSAQLWGMLQFEFSFLICPDALDALNARARWRNPMDTTGVKSCSHLRRLPWRHNGKAQRGVTMGRHNGRKRTGKWCKMKNVTFIVCKQKKAAFVTYWNVKSRILWYFLKINFYP
jgi:hypothetical protein